MSIKKTMTATIAFIAIANSASAYDITNAIDAALKNNTQLKAGELRLEGSKLNRLNAATSFLPSIGAQRQLSQTIVGGEEVKGGSPVSDALSIGQEIFSGGRGLYNLKASKFISEAAVIDYQDAIDKIIITTVQAYEQVIGAREIYNVRVQNVQSLQRIVQEAEVRLSVGAITRTNMLEARAKLAAAISDKERSYADMVSAEENFRYVTGDVAPAAIADIDVSSLVLPQNVENFINEVSLNNQSIISSEKTLQAKRLATKAAKATMLPTVSAGAQFNRSLSWQQQDMFGMLPRVLGESRSNTYQLSLNIPIFQRGTEYVRIKEAQIGEAAALNARNNVTLELKRDAASAWHRHLQAKASVIADMQSVDQYKAFVAGAEQEFNIGTKTLTDLLQAKVAYENAKTNVIQDKTQLVIAKLQMKYLLGQMKTINFSNLVVKESLQKTEKVQKVNKSNDPKVKRIASIET